MGLAERVGKERDHGRRRRGKRRPKPRPGEADALLSQIDDLMDELDFKWTTASWLIGEGIEETALAVDRLRTAERQLVKRHGAPLELPDFDDQDHDGEADWDYDESDHPITAAPRVGRNEPCPCGSGRKYKKCCGASA